MAETWSEFEEWFRQDEAELKSEYGRMLSLGHLVRAQEQDEDENFDRSPLAYVDSVKTSASKR